MKKLLVVVDMQNDFIDQALGTAEAQAIVPFVVNEILNGDYDRLPEQAFMFVGTIEDAVKKANTLG